MAFAIINENRLKEVLNYDSETGIFTWAKTIGRRAKQGSIAGSLTNEGYINIKIDKTLYRAHRLAWIHVHGVMPQYQIDHINGIKSDNRIINLRDVEQSTNQENHRKAKSNNKVGLLGVSCKKQKTKYEAQIKVKGKVKYLGSYKTADEAHEVYLKAKRELHEGSTI